MNYRKVERAELEIASERARQKESDYSSPWWLNVITIALFIVSFGKHFLFKNGKLALKNASVWTIIMNAGLALKIVRFLIAVFSDCVNLIDGDLDDIDNGKTADLLRKWNVALP